ncbi:MAG: pentapeptide repeat-containing protein [Pseudonocardiaceae bacterium]
MDLTGTLLLEFSLRNCQLDHADFGGAQFTGYADFGGARFTGRTSFWRAQFTSHTSASRAA